MPRCRLRSALLLLAILVLLPGVAAARPVTSDSGGPAALRPPALFAAVLSRLVDLVSFFWAADSADTGMSIDHHGPPGETVDTGMTIDPHG